MSNVPIRPPPLFNRFIKMQIKIEFQEKKRRSYQLRDEVRRCMRKDGDYAAYYHVPITGSWARVHKEFHKERRDGMGWRIDPPSMASKRED